MPDSTPESMRGVAGNGKGEETSVDQNTLQVDRIARWIGGERRVYGGMRAAKWNSLSNQSVPWPGCCEFDFEPCPWIS